MQKQYDAILFDFDGVLADTEPLHCEAWRRALEPLGITFDWEFYRTKGVGISDSDLLALLATLSQPSKPVEELWQRFPIKQRLFLEMARENPPFSEAVKLLLTSLKNRSLGLVSSTSRQEILPLIRAAGLTKIFRVVICAEDVTRLKPDPEPYLEAARRLNAVNPLVVEDSEAGVRAARAAGFDVIRVAGPSEVPGKLRAALDGLDGGIGG